ncbi:MAG: Nramp family divalent metal transporter [Pseudomonadales bacterium]
MTIAIPPLQSADLPDREIGFWKLTGPGAIMIGLAIGSGEMVLWPWITAKFGTEMMWAAALGVFLQLFINIEVGRWAVATGESPFTGFARVSRLWVFFFISLLLVGAFLPGMGRAVGTSLRILFFGEHGPGADWMWTALVIAIALLILFGPKRIYTTVEKSVLSMVLFIVVGMVVVAISVGTLDDMFSMFRGILNFGHLRFDEDFTVSRFFGAFVFAGIGGLGNLYYAYYLRDKGVGMGKRIPMLLNPLREAQRGNSEIGYLYPESVANADRFKAWFKFVITDSVVFFWLANTFTMFLFMFGALVVLYPAGIVPEESTIIWDLALILESTMGIWGRYLFLVIGIAAFFSSVLAGIDGGVRLWVDLLHSNFKAPNRFAANRLYLAFAVGLGTLGVLATWFFETFDVTVLDFFFIGAMLGGFAMAGYVPMLLYMNLKYLPPSARPGVFNIIMMVVAAITYISFAVYTVAAKLIELVG